MFNTEKPSLEELPTSKQLLRSTLIAIAGAFLILIVVILPSEYAIDVTGLGRALGLTEMGEIKQELQQELEDDLQKNDISSEKSSILSNITSLFISTAQAQTTTVKNDWATFTIEPGGTYEVKMTMKKDDTVKYQMEVSGGRVNFDLHGHGGGNSKTYEKGRGSKGADGNFTAAFDGEHGWFWRNRDNDPLTINITVSGTYSKIRQGN